jgi:hypothetical protein
MRRIAIRDMLEEAIVQNLIEALDQLREDLDKVELWTAALRCFQAPVPDYEPADRFILPPSSRGGPPRNASRSSV